jgi:tetratricopeptide (TPR) repeat protein
MNHSIKEKFSLTVLFCFWIICGALTLTAVVLKTHNSWFSSTKKDVDDRYAIKMLNFHLPDHYAELAEALTNTKLVPPNFVTYFELTVQYLPQDFASHYLLGICYQNNKKWDQANAAYRKAIELNPYFFWTYYNLGGMYWQNQQHGMAMQIWKAAAQLPPELTLKALGSTKLLTDCLKDPAFKGHDPSQSLLQAVHQVLEWGEKRKTPEYFNPVLF